MLHRFEDSTLVSENVLTSLCDLLAEVRILVEKALCRAEDRIRERLVEAHQERAGNGQPEGNGR